MEDKIEKGGKILFVLICILLSIDGINLLFLLVTWNFGDLLTRLVRVTLSCVLYYFLYKGHGWAKILTVNLMLISVVVGLVVLSSSEKMFLSVIMTAFCGLYVTVLLIFAFSSSVKAHWQNERNYREYGA